MPEVSTMTRSKPATRQAAIAPGSEAEISAPEARVASERMNTFSVWIEFIRMRSPSSAPPVLRRDGSTAMTAIFSLSPWSSRNRRTSSSVIEDLPAPPVPVMPSAGTVLPAASLSRLCLSFASSDPASIDVMSCESARRLPCFNKSRLFGAYCAVSKSQRASMSLIMPCRPIFWPSSGE
jgi:hypothetical protein